MVSPLSFRLNGTRIFIAQFSIISAVMSVLRAAIHGTAGIGQPLLCVSKSHKDTVTYIYPHGNSSMSARTNGKDSGDNCLSVSGQCNSFSLETTKDGVWSDGSGGKALPTMSSEL